MSKLVYAAGALALATLAPPVYAASDADLAEIRGQIKSLKDDYEARIRALEQRLKDAEARAAAPAPAPSAASRATGIAAFNPAFSLVLSGVYANLSQDPASFAIAGFAPEGEIGPGRRGFGLGESEITVSANVDPYFAGQATIAFSPESEVSVEEAYGIYTGAPFGLTPKFGRFLSGIGYMNEQHAHAWDFVDAPLAYQAFLGGRYVNDGLQVKWVAPLQHFIELGAEAGNGDSFPGGPRSTNGFGSTAFYAHTGGDIGASHSWRAGVSQLRTKRDCEEIFCDVSTLSQRLAIADFVWKWAPDGNARRTNFKVQGEYFRSTGDTPTQSGWYAQAVYQPVPAWRIGARLDRLDPGSVDPFRPRKWTAMIDWSPSEFSRVRVQYARSETMPELMDRQWFVQYILSLGAHGAHKY